MNKICSALNALMGFSPMCLMWMKQAGEHCLDVLTMRKHDFWGTLPQMLFPKRVKEIAGPDEEIKIPKIPEFLTREHCAAVFSVLSDEYFVESPKYLGTTMIYEFNWQIFLNLVDILMIGSIILGCNQLLVSIRAWWKTANNKIEVSKKRIEASREVKYTDRKIKERLYRTCLVHTQQEDEADLSIKWSPEINFENFIVSNDTHAVDQPNPDNQGDSNYKLEKIPKLMNFLRNCRKIDVDLFYNNETESYDELIMQRTGPSRIPRANQRAKPPK